MGVSHGVYTQAYVSFKILQLSAIHDIHTAVDNQVAILSSLVFIQRMFDAVFSNAWLNARSDEPKFGFREMKSSNCKRYLDLMNPAVYNSTTTCITQM